MSALSRRLLLPPALGLGLALLAACEMLPAELLDRPRVLAIAADPAGLPTEGAVTLEAFLWEVDGPVRWSFCPVAFAPTSPVSCPEGGGEIGEGPVVDFTPDATVDSVWVKAEAEGVLPAVKLLRRGDTITNPPLLGLVTDGGAALPERFPAGGVVAVRPRFVEGTSGHELVTSWYVTAGELEPARTVGSEVATWTLGADVRGDVTVVAVTRSTAGGTAWSLQRLEAGP